MKATHDLLIVICSSNQAVTIFRRQVDIYKSNIARFVNSNEPLIDIKGNPSANLKMKAEDIQVIEHIGNELVNINSKVFVSKVSTTYVFINFFDDKQSYLKAWEITIPNDESQNTGPDHALINDFSQFTEHLKGTRFRIFGGMDTLIITEKEQF